MADFISPTTNIDIAGIPLPAAGGDAPLVVPGLMPDHFTIIALATSLYDVGANPMIVSPLLPGAIFFVRNNQTGPFLVKGPQPTDPGFLVPPGATIMVGDGDQGVSGNAGFLVALGGTTGAGTDTPLLASAAHVVLTNVASLAAFTVASSAANDNVASVQSQVIVLLGQTVPAQNGPYVVGLVTAGVAPLTRPSWWATGSTFNVGSMIQVRQGTVYGASTLKTFATGVVGTNDPFLIPNLIVQQLLLIGGTVTISNVPIMAAAKTIVTHTRLTPFGTANTIEYNPASITAGELVSGAPAVIFDAMIAAGTINAADGSTLNVGVQQW